MRISSVGLGLAFAVLLAGGAAAPATAQPELGTLLFCDADNDRVHDIRDGGDFTLDIPFASFVLLVQDVCLGPNGDLYATELVSGEIKIITAGGSFNGAPPFASGLVNPGGLACSESQILVAETGTGTIADATGGGNVAGGPRYAVGLPNVSDLFRDSSGTLWASTQDGNIWDVSAGGDFTLVPPFATGGGFLRGMEEFDGMLLVADQSNDAVVDFTTGGNFAVLPVFATFFGPRHLIPVPGIGLLAAKVSEVLEISAGGDFTGATPFAEGFSEAFLGGFEYIGTCGPVALSGCRAATKASLSIVEQKPGKEKWKASLAKFDAPTTLADLGDPVAGNTTYALCLYDGADRLVAEVPVDRGGALCGSSQKPCWKATGTKGFRYKDPEAAAGGAKKLTAKIGDLGKGKLKLQAANNAKKAQENLQTGVAASLAGATSARLQLDLTDGACFEASLTDVKKADGLRFKAKTP